MECKVGFGSYAQYGNGGIMVPFLGDEMCAIGSLTTRAAPLASLWQSMVHAHACYECGIIRVESYISLEIS